MLNYENGRENEKSPGIIDSRCYGIYQHRNGCSGEHIHRSRWYYKRALTKAWERLGYPGELARVRTDLVYTSEADDLEWLAERAKDGQIRKEKRAQVYKVIGDVRRKQGQTEAAFQNYLEALRQNGSGFVRTELSRIFLTDLYEGSKRAAVYAKAGDASEFLNQWLGKYGSIEEIQQLVKECL